MSFVKDTYLMKEKIYLKTNWYKYSSESFYHTYSMNPLMATSIEVLTWPNLIQYFSILDVILTIWQT